MATPPDASSGSAFRRYIDKGFEKDDEGYYPKSREAILVRWSVWAAAVFFGMAMAQLVFGVFLR